LPSKLDTIAHYQTPEGVELSLSLAGPMVRGMAWFIDFAIRLVLYIILGITVGMLGGMGRGLFFIGLFVIEWFYPVLFEVHNGMTPGKKVMGLQVVHEDGTPLSWSSALLRNLIRCIDLLPFFNMTGFITMLMNSSFKRLGDLAAGTVVVYHWDVTKGFSIPDAPPSPAPVPLKLEEQRLVLDFCERAADLSEQRRRELAFLLTDITGGDVPENRLLAIGNWFLRGKGAHESKSL
jgi:uncharacterized RDD family membrane protein YckC